MNIRYEGVIDTVGLLPVCCPHYYLPSVTSYFVQIAKPRPYRIPTEKILLIEDELFKKYISRKK